MIEGYFEVGSFWFIGVPLGFLLFEKDRISDKSPKTIDILPSFSSRSKDQDNFLQWGDLYFRV